MKLFPPHYKNINNTSDYYRAFICHTIIHAIFEKGSALVAKTLLLASSYCTIMHIILYSY